MAGSAQSCACATNENCTTNYQLHWGLFDQTNQATTREGRALKYCLEGGCVVLCQVCTIPVPNYPVPCSFAVTAPSSPLSPPISPLFPTPEPSSSRNGECTVCFDSEVDTVIYTCGHMCLCNTCGLKLKKQLNACCPICRRVIKDVIKIYRP